MRNEQGAAASSPIAQHAAEVLQLLEGSEPDWAAVSNHWFELSLASKGTSWGATVDWFGDLICARDAEALTQGLAALQNNSGGGAKGGRVEGA